MSRAHPESFSHPESSRRRASPFPRVRLCRRVRPVIELVRYNRVMLADCPFYANIPVSDLAASRAFYERVLDMPVIRADEHEAVLRAGNTRLTLYPFQHPTYFSDLVRHTIGTFLVTDIEARVQTLRERGVAFEEYDLPELHMKDGIATVRSTRMAWFRDPDLNLLSITQEMGSDGGE